MHDTAAANNMAWRYSSHLEESLADYLAPSINLTNTPNGVAYVHHSVNLAEFINLCCFFPCCILSLIAYTDSL